jgi:hypothetical protein
MRVPTIRAASSAAAATSGGGGVQVSVTDRPATVAYCFAERANGRPERWWRACMP